MTVLNIPDEYILQSQDDRTVFKFNLTIFTKDDKVRFSVGETGTSWLSLNDNFLKRIQFDRLNPYYLEKHLAKEIEIKNKLDEGINYLDNQKYPKAIECFDEALWYDPTYAEALFFKSKAIFGQGHFVKSLRNYKKAIKSDASLRDVDYHKLLLAKSSKERDGFPKIKRNIYAGDEYFSNGDYENALESYDKALANPTDFKNRILTKLLNKKATALLRLNRIDEAMEVFKKSVSVRKTDYACYYLGICSKSPNHYLDNAVKITKKQLLGKAFKLNEFGEHDSALNCLDEFLENHFVIDEDYKRALNLKYEVLKYEEVCLDM